MTALYVNGIDATNGEYLLPPVDVQDVARAVLTREPGQFTERELRARHQGKVDAHYAPKHGIDARELAQTGWGIVTASEADPAIVAALRPLLELRERQAAAVAESRFRVLTGVDGYRPGESKQDFQARLGVGPGPVDPDVLPYHLLLIGGPEEIPFAVQYQLDIQHSVGRLHFQTVDEYSRYAENVVASEHASRRVGPGHMCMFAPRNEGDPATEASAAQLATPLADALGKRPDEWAVAKLVGPDARKEDLVRLLASRDRPDVLFTASHGAGYPCGHPDQLRRQGALICQDWPGPGRGKVLPEHCFAADDVEASTADLTGLVVFLFACFGAGTPRQDDFGPSQPGAVPLARSPFLAALPQSLLGREGGALAVLGHVERAWTYSFRWPGAGAQTEVFRSSLACLAEGYPVGAALEYMGDRYAEIAAELAQVLHLAKLGKRTDDNALAGLWTAYADARNFILLGDPAVRLRGPAGVDTSAGQGATVTSPTAGPPDPSVPAPSSEVIEVATFVTDDSDAVTIDPATGRIRGARLHVSSRIHLDGSAEHVVTRPGPFASANAEREMAVTELHARLLEVSLRARQDSGKDGGQT